MALIGHRRVRFWDPETGLPAALNPVATPEIGIKVQSESGNNSGAQSTAMLPTVGQLIENYIQALGGAPAIEKITSRVKQGTSQYRGQSANVEILTEQPGKQMIIRHLARGESMSVFDGGWLIFPNQPLHEMYDADIVAARMDADLQFALYTRQMFPDLRIKYSEKIAGRDVYVLVETRASHPSHAVLF